MNQPFIAAIVGLLMCTSVGMASDDQPEADPQPAEINNRARVRARRLVKLRVQDIQQQNLGEARKRGFRVGVDATASIASPEAMARVRRSFKTAPSCDSTVTGSTMAM